MTNTVIQGIVLPWLSAFALALLPILGSLALALLRKHGVNTVWYEAVARAGGVSYAALLASGRPVTDRTALVAAAKVGADYLTQRVGGIAASKALDPAALAQIAGAELGKLLAVDPAVAVPVGEGRALLPVVAVGDTPPA